MLRNYFKIAWRNLLRNKLFSIIIFQVSRSVCRASIIASLSVGGYSW